MRHSYRPDIDGLRAIAVAAVLIFHAFPTALPGGFIGVDIFFVISGYLICGILLDDLDKGHFSLLGFYARRIRRIFPALLAVLATGLVLGWYYLLASEYQQLGKHALGVTGFVSNFLFWSEASYFDNAADTKPLLHLWSLAVEEQFYILFPLLIWFAGKRGSLFGWLVGGLSVLAFIYNMSHVQANGNAAFYSPVSRFWELACGALLAYFHHRNSSMDDEGEDEDDDDESSSANLPFVIGCLLIGAGFFFIDKSRAFPGGWALLPVVGAALLIHAGSSSSTNRLLSNPVLVWLGLISYPLYLWHWLLLSFAHIQLSGTPSVTIRAGALILSVALAWLTYVLLEKPIRANGYIAKKVILLLTLMLAVAALSLYVFQNSGLPDRTVHNLSQYFAASSPPPVAQPKAVKATATTPSQTAAPIVPQKEIAIEKDSEATDKMRALLKVNLRTNSGYVDKLTEAKMKAARYRECHMFHDESDAKAFSRYLQQNSKCIKLSNEKKNILIIGDSAAADIYASLTRFYPDIHFLQITGSACKPFLAAYLNEAPQCEKMIRYALDFAVTTKLDGVILASMWADDFALTKRELVRLRDAGKNVALGGPPLLFSAAVPIIVQRLSPKDPLDAALERTLVKSHIELSNEMENFAASKKVGYISWQKLYCEGGCPILSDNGAFMILDEFHLSIHGMDRLGMQMKKHRVLEKIFQVE